MGWLSFLTRKKADGVPQSMKYLIAGLGNVGDKYAGTRHNVGFRVANALAGDTPFDDKRYGLVARKRVKNAELILLKPSTYVNLSGNAVRYWMQKEKVELENILVVCDDISLPVGTIRMKPSGSDAGHNGLKNIAQVLGTQAYARLRIGIGNDYPRGGQIDFVLGRFTADEEKLINAKAETAAEAVKAFALSGIQFAMNHYNGK